MIDHRCGGGSGGGGGCGGGDGWCGGGGGGGWVGGAYRTSTTPSAFSVGNKSFYNILTNKMYLLIT